jgi:hypothetical protein
MRQDITEKLVSFYRDDVPGYIRDAGRTFLKIHFVGSPRLAILQKNLNK